APTSSGSIRQNKIGQIKLARSNWPGGNDMTTIAFIGLGNMGGPMAANLVKAGHKVVAFDLVGEARNQAKADGAAVADSAVASVKGAEVVITMLPAGKHVISVWNEVVPSMTRG